MANHWYEKWEFSSAMLKRKCNSEKKKCDTARWNVLKINHKLCIFEWGDQKYFRPNLLSSERIGKKAGKKANSIESSTHFMNIIFFALFAWKETCWMAKKNREKASERGNKKNPAKKKLLEENMHSNKWMKSMQNVLEDDAYKEKCQKLWNVD